jgi:hypothetical protein
MLSVSVIVTRVIPMITPRIDFTFINVIAYSRYSSSAKEQIDKIVKVFNQDVFIR